MSEGDLFQQAAPHVVERLGRGLLAVQAGQQRVVYLDERLREGEALPVVRALACAQREAMLGSLYARVLIDTFGALVEQQRLDPVRRGALVAGATMLGEHSVIPLVNPAAANDEQEDARRARAKKGSLAEAGETLGRRKSLARTATGDMLLRILDDPHPDVIRNALLNPNLVEAHAVRVAARRPVPPAVLEQVARSRFANRHAVRRALVLNPDCPSKLACRLVATLSAADLEDLCATSDVRPDVKSAAALLLRALPR